GRGPRLPQFLALPVAPGQQDRARLRAWRRRPAGPAPGQPAVLLAQDGQVQLPCPRRRVGAELAAEPLPQCLVGGQCLACSPAAAAADIYQRCAASSSGSAATAASAKLAARRGSPVASDASAAASRTRRSSSRSCSRARSAQSAYGSSLIAVPADSSSCARSAAARATAAAVPSLPSACSQNPAATSRSTTTSGPAASR